MCVKYLKTSLTAFLIGEIFLEGKRVVREIYNKKQVFIHTIRHNKLKRAKRKLYNSPNKGVITYPKN